ncbi:MAG: hypothetical protein ACM31K_00045 [Solirubrobacterales bacterium]
MICTGNLRAAALAISLALASVTLVACGSGESGPVTQRPAVSAATADRLAKLSDRIASDLTAGDTCQAAHAADNLRSAVERSDLPDRLRPDVDAAAATLVDEVNCPPPPPPPPPQGHQPKKKTQKPDKPSKDHHGGDRGPLPPGHGGKLPPGQAKLKGEVG